MPAITHADIATRAYFLWINEGRPHGRDQQHWLCAEAELTAVRTRKRARPLAIPARDATVSEAPAKPKRPRAAAKATTPDTARKSPAPRRKPRATP